MMNPIVIDPPGFDQKAGWQECSDYVDKCGGLAYEDGEPNWRAAFGADPGVCSCPACGEMYWCWGRVQRCAVCQFEYPTDAWPAYSEGCDAGMRLSGKRVCPDAEAHERMIAYSNKKYNQRKDNPYFLFGFEHPVANAYWHYEKTDWKFVLLNPGADMYTPSERISEQLKNTFQYHRPSGNQAERYERLRDEGGKLAHMIATNTPESREQSVALTKLQEVIMFANAAIAINEYWDGNTMTKPMELTVETTGRPRG
jgi:hypothetical protein